MELSESPRKKYAGKISSCYVPDYHKKQRGSSAFTHIERNISQNGLLSASSMDVVIEIFRIRLNPKKKLLFVMTDKSFSL